MIGNRKKDEWGGAGPLQDSDLETFVPDVSNKFRSGDFLYPPTVFGFAKAQTSFAGSLEVLVPDSRCQISAL